MTSSNSLAESKIKEKLPKTFTVRLVKLTQLDQTDSLKAYLSILHKFEHAWTIPIHKVKLSFFFSWVSICMQTK